MSTVLLILVIGVLNFCVGFAIAVRLGFGPPNLADAWEAMVSDPSQGAPFSFPRAADTAQFSRWDEVAEPGRQDTDDRSTASLSQELILPPDWQGQSG